MISFLVSLFTSLFFSISLELAVGARALSSLLAAAFDCAASASLEIAMVCELELVLQSA
jgi:hypothetical protein